MINSLPSMLPADHPFSSLESIPFHYLQNEKFILCAGGSYIRKKIMAECEKNNFKPDVLFTPLQVLTAFNMVASGAGISFVLDGEIAVIKNKPRIIIKPLQEPIKFEAGFI